MKKELEFLYPFTGFTNLDFTNCFTSAYMFLEKITGLTEYECKARDGKGCDGCGNCGNTLSGKQERLFFLFGTLTGRTALRNCWAGADTTLFLNENRTQMQKELDDTDEMIGFLMGYAGYDYRKSADGIMKDIISSIDEGKPVLARMKNIDKGSFRIITGYDGGTIICASPSNAQTKPEGNPAYGEIDSIYIFGGKITPKYSLRDGLLRIRKVMEYNESEKLWDEYIKKFHYWDEKLADAEFDEIKTRFQKAAKTMWYTFNCHNFQQAMENKIWLESGDADRIKENISEISRATDWTHTQAWQIIALEGCRDWSSRRYNELEWGMCESVAMCLKSIKKNDEDVLRAVNNLIDILK